MLLFIVPILISLLAVLFSIFLDSKYSTQKIENIEIKALSRKLSKAVWAHIIKTYQLSGAVTGVLAILMLIIPAFGFKAVLGLVLGMLMSFVVIYFACIFVIRLNSRIVSRSSHGFADSFNSIFSGGGLLALLISGMAVLSVSGYHFIFNPPASGLVGLALGSAIVAFFLKVGGRIYKETADNGVDPHEQQKESRNPQVIIRLAGSAVIRPLGLIADLFATLITLMVGAMLVSSFLLPGFGGGIVLPLLVVVSGMISSFVGTQLIKIGVTINILRNIAFAVLGIVILAIILISPSVLWAMSGSAQISQISVLASSTLGLLLGGGILFLNYALNSSKHANTLVAGIFGALIFLAIYANSWLGGWYGVTIFVVSMISLSGTALALHMFNSVSAASKEMARLADLPEEHRKPLEKMDVVRDTVHLTLSRYVLLASMLGFMVLSMLYNRETIARSPELDFSLDQTTVLAGVFLGLSVFYFLAYFIGKFIKEETQNRRPGDNLSLDAQDGANYAGLSNSIASFSAKKTLKIFIPAISIPILIGFLWRAEVLGGFLMGIIIFGGLWSVSKTFNKPSISAKEGKKSDSAGNNYYIDKTASFYSPIVKLMALVSLLLIIFLV